MAITPKALIAAKYAENAQTTQYTATNVKVRIDSFTVTNNTGGAVTFACNLVVNGGSAAASNLVLSRSIAANSSYNCPELIGKVMESGGFISTLAGAATSLVIMAGGVEIT